MEIAFLKDLPIGPSRTAVSEKKMYRLLDRVSPDGAQFVQATTKELELDDRGGFAYETTICFCDAEGEPIPSADDFFIEDLNHEDALQRAGFTISQQAWAYETKDATEGKASFCEEVQDALINTLAELRSVREQVVTVIKYFGPWLSADEREALVAVDAYAQGASSGASLAQMALAPFLATTQADTESPRDE